MYLVYDIFWVDSWHIYMGPGEEIRVRAEEVYYSLSQTGWQLGAYFEIFAEIFIDRRYLIELFNLWLFCMWNQRFPI